MIRARRVWITLSSSLWFIPATLVTLALVLAATLVQLSAGVDAAALDRWPRIFGAGADGARGVLSTIAGSMITVAGVTFSITIAALALASAQYTPRVLRTFMADRANQLVLGVFVGIFAYCLVVLRTIRGGDEGAFVPSIAVLGGVVLALIGTAVLIFFVHHIADALQASTILERVRVATERAIDEMYPALAGDDTATGDRVPDAVGAWLPVPSHATGYVQGVNVVALAELAGTCGGIIRMERGVGDFVVEGDPLCSFAAESRGGTGASLHESLRSGVRRHHAIARYRTVEQDPAFGILQIVDMALKALSPGVNDTTTATGCVDHLGALLARVGARQMADGPRRMDGVIRLIPIRPSFEGLVTLALDDIRRNAGGNVRVLLRLCDAIAVAGRHTSLARRRDSLAAQLGLIEDQARRTVPAPDDRASISERVRGVRLSLGQLAEGGAP